MVWLLVAGITSPQGAKTLVMWQRRDTPDMLSRGQLCGTNGGGLLTASLQQKRRDALSKRQTLVNQ